MTGEEAYWAGIGPYDFPDEEVEIWPCNDCGEPCPKFDELCETCYKKQLDAEEWDLLHPEARCPPRE